MARRAAWSAGSTSRNSRKPATRRKSQGWTPIIVDTNGNGKRGEFVEANAPLDPAKDKRVMAAFYGVQPSPVDDSIWGQAMDIGFSRIEQPGYLMRLVPGANPSETALTEVYLPPDDGYGSRGIDVTSKGVMWTVLSSGHIASFDRTQVQRSAQRPKCDHRQALSGGLDALPVSRSAVQRREGRGQRPTTPITSGSIATTRSASATTCRSPCRTATSRMIAVVDGKFVNLHVPYPMGFFTKNADGRIDDANAGWKGRGLWTTSGTRTVFHNEGGKDNSPKVYKMQVRPDPLGH